MVNHLINADRLSSITELYLCLQAIKRREAMEGYDLLLHPVNRFGTEPDSGVVKGGREGGRPPPPNCVQDHSKSLNPCRSWDPLECLRRSLLAPPPKKNNDPGYATGTRTFLQQKLGFYF